MWPIIQGSAGWLSLFTPSRSFNPEELKDTRSGNADVNDMSVCVGVFVCVCQLIAHGSNGFSDSYTTGCGKHRKAEVLDVVRGCVDASYWYRNTACCCAYM